MKRTSEERRTRAVDWREIKHIQPPTAAPRTLLYPNYPILTPDSRRGDQ